MDIDCLGSVRAFDFAALAFGGPMLKPMQGFFELRDGESVLAALELAVLIELDTRLRNRDHRLNESAVRLVSICAASKRAVLPFDGNTNCFRVSASGIAVSIEIVVVLEGLLH